MEIRTKRLIAIILNALFIPMELYAIIKMAISEKLVLFKFYTNLSNILLLITSSIYISIPLKNKTVEVEFPHYIVILRYLSSVMLFITWLVCITILCPMVGQWVFLLFEERFLFLHTLCPILSFISFLIFEDNSSLTFKETFIPLIVTIIYGIFVIILYVTNVTNAPYPFLEIKTNPVYQSILFILGIIIGCYVISFLIRFIYLKINRENLRNTTALEKSANQMDESVKKSFIYD